MPGTSAAALLYGPSEHHLDHLAPLADFYDIPLIVTQEEVVELAKRYYPAVNVQHVDYLRLPFHLLDKYETVFSCLPRVSVEEICFLAQAFSKKRIATIWCPHGNSDKGHASPFMEALCNEERALVYGDRMVEFLKNKGAFDQLKQCEKVGNLRYAFYQKHKSFYQALVEKEILPLLKKGVPTILYAPTWQDCENSSSFEDIAPILVEKLPANFNLIVKPHPNQLNTCEQDGRTLFLENFPPIYPLLDLVDIYVGDMSSIGYDFLAFQKPMFFLNQNMRDLKNDPGLYLYQCGTVLEPEDYAHIFQIIEKATPHDKELFLKVRQKVYSETFSETCKTVVHESIRN